MKTPRIPGQPAPKVIPAEGPYYIVEHCACGTFYRGDVFAPSDDVDIERLLALGAISRHEGPAPVAEAESEG